MQNRGGGPPFSQNFRPQCPPQQFFHPPPQRFQGHNLQPWPEMGNFGAPRGAMSQSRMNSPPPSGQFPGQQNNFNNGQNMRPNMRQNGPWNGPRFQHNGHAGPPNRPPPGPQSGPPRFFRNPGAGFQRPNFQGQGNKQHQQNPNQHKKMKTDKRDLPENNRYYCEVCDRGYKDEDKYQIHLNTHETCPREGCAFTAASKLVQLHIKMQHDSGMAKKIWSLESAEDIQKWREERKKHFPTAENIAKKKAVLAERIARGEVIEDKYFGKMRGRGERGQGRGKGRDRGRGRGRNRGNNRDDLDLKRKADGDGLGVVDGEASGSKKQCQGQTGRDDPSVKERMETLGVFFQAAKSDAESSSDESSSDEDDIASKKTSSANAATPTATPATADVKAAGALGSLIASYDVSDDEESDDSSPEEVKSKGKSPNQKDGKISTAQGNTGPSAQTSINRNARQKARQRGRANKKNKKDLYALPSVDKTLLEKLLAKEIRQERNKIMQCVHYIVANKFFDKTQSENKPTTEVTIEKADHISEVTSTDKLLSEKSSAESIADKIISEKGADKLISENSSADKLISEKSSETITDKLISEKEADNVIVADISSEKLTSEECADNISDNITDKLSTDDNTGDNIADNSADKSVVQIPIT